MAKTDAFFGKVVFIPSYSTEPIMDFAVGKYAEIMFKVDNYAETGTKDDGEVGYGIRITTSNEYPVTDKFASKTFEASFYIPKEEQYSPIEWSFSNLPSGLGV